MYIEENKIKKYQSGGSFAVYQPLPLMAPQPPAPLPAQSSKASEQGEPALDKEIVKKLMGEGIANDVMSFSEGINAAYKQYQSLSEFERTTVRGQMLRDVMKGDLGQLNLLMRNKKEFDQSIEKVKSQDAYGELAITARGLVVKDLTTGKLSEISHEAFAQDLRSENKKYQSLTNAELINEREYNPSLVNDKGAINALNSSVGMEAVKKEITSVLSNLGSDSKNDSKSFYLDSTESPEMKAAAKQLATMARDGVYKIDQMASSETNERQLKAAATGMWHNLSNASRSLLKARAVANGAAPNEIENTALSYALELLNPASKTSTTTKSDVSYDDALSKSGKEDKEDLTSDVSYWQAADAAAGNPGIIELDNGGGNQLKVLGAVMGPMQSNGKVVGQTSLRNIPELKSLVNMNNAYFGNNKIDPNFIDAVVYRGDDAVIVKMPAIKDGNGGMKPDLAAAPKYNKLMEELQTIPNAMIREKLINQAGYQMNPATLMPDVQTADFVTFNAMINDYALGSSNYDKTYTKQVQENMEKQYEKAYRYNGENADKEGADLKPEEYDRWFARRWLNPIDILQGAVYIEAKSNPVSTRLADGKTIATSKYNNSSQGLSQSTIFRKPATQARTGVLPEFTLQ